MSSPQTAMVRLRPRMYESFFSREKIARVISKQAKYRSYYKYLAPGGSAQLTQFRSGTFVPSAN
jgi:hypothetical protein